MAEQLFAAHIQLLQQRVADILSQSPFDALVIHGGQPLRRFLDDQDYPFYANPHAAQWLPQVPAHTWLVVDGVGKPRLYWYQPNDFWHGAPELPQPWWAQQFDITYFSRVDAIGSLLPYDREHLAYLGAHPEVAAALGFTNCNPEQVMHYMHYHRASKTPYEISCIAMANRITWQGIKAIELGLAQGASEWALWLSFQQACQQGADQLPYAPIIAWNEHAAVLHHHQLSQQRPERQLSLLIDVGAGYRGYGADVSRTYAAADGGDFSQLISAMDVLQLQLINQIRRGDSYVDLHLLCHRHIAELLQQTGMVQAPVDDIVESGLSALFFPHGLGHHLGLQTHDMGGLIRDERGTLAPAPAQHPFLRNTRRIESGQVLTIEPGLYFIDSLIAQMKQHPLAQHIDWAQLAHWQSYGGIRIEDNIVISEQGVRNLTREAQDA